MKQIQNLKGKTPSTLANSHPKSKTPELKKSKLHNARHRITNFSKLKKALNFESLISTSMRWNEAQWSQTETRLSRRAPSSLRSRKGRPSWRSWRRR